MKSSKGLALCPAQLTLDVIRGRWKLLILRELVGDTRRTGQILRALDGSAKNRLNQSLRELERHGIVRRQAYRGRIQRVEYSLTKRGRSLCPIIDALHRWGVNNKLRFANSAKKSNS